MKTQRCRQGFTLVETLVATLVVAMLSAALMAGVAASAGIYSDARFSSESEILANTLNTAMGDVLHFAVCDSDSGAFVNRNYGITAGHFLVQDGRLLLSPDESEDEESLLSLISSGAYTNLKIKAFSMQYDPSTALFTGDYTIAGTERQSVTISFAFRALNGEG